MVHRHDDRAGAEEEAGLEERVREDVEHPDAERPDPAGQEHVAELRDGGVGEDLLDVVLGEADRRGEDRGPGADPGDERQRVGGEDEDGRAAGDEVDPGRDHRGGVDEGRDRRRAGHRVGEPDVERHLRALADRAEEEEEADRVDGDRRAAVHRPLLRHVDEGEVRRAEEGEDPEDPEDHPVVADPVRDERLLAGGVGEVLVVVVADEEVGAEPDALPADEEDREAVREDERQHREHEEVQVGEVAPVPFLVLQVADAVDVDQEPDERDERQHHGRQRVEPERDVHGHVPGGHPAPGGLDHGGEPSLRREGAGDVGDEVRERDDGGEADGEDPDDAVQEPLPVGEEGARVAVGVVVVGVPVGGPVGVAVVAVVVRVLRAPRGGRLRRPAPAAEEGDEAVHEEAREGKGGDEPEGERHGFVSLTTSGSRSRRRRSSGAPGRGRRRSRGRPRPRPRPRR